MSQGHDEWLATTTRSFDPRESRWGQHYMNCLPERLYREITGGHDDPFYSDRVPESVYDWVSAFWEDSSEIG